MKGRETSARMGEVDRPVLRAAGASPDLSLLPSVDAVLGGPAAAELAAWSRDAAVQAVREAIGGWRERLLRGEAVEREALDPGAVGAAAARNLRASSRPRLKRVVNATGVVLHTNLGRACLAESAIEAVVEVARGACNLEYDVDSGARGQRDSLVEEHLCALTGAEAATVVNNNAAAVVLALAALAQGRQVVVSRGELVEIGGSFRIPEIMAAAGATLCEVGTTNRTHLADYRSAIGPDTALLMKIHASNYRIVGFTAAVELAELVELASEHGDLPVIEDLGAGALVDLSGTGAHPEPVVADRIRAGAHLVLASGDKLLGGPQCGIVVGRAALVDKLRRHPLKRALRCDKMTLAALEATLRLYRFSASAETEIPTLRYLLRPVEELRRIGEEAIALLAARLGAGFSFELVASQARAGSGSWPDVPIESLAVAVRGEGLGPVAIEKMFRGAAVPVIGRIEDDEFLLDLRLLDDARDLVPTAEAR